MTKNSNYKFLPLDQNGNIINTASKDKIKAPWDKPIELIVDVFKELLGDNLRAVYFDGSIVRGEAIEGKSDIDCSALVNDSNKVNKEKLRLAMKEIRLSHPFIFKIDWGFYTEDELINEYIHDKMIIKTLGICYWGEDISHKISPYKPDLKLAQDLQHSIRKFYERGLEKISFCPEEDLAGWCTWMMKRFVRTGFFICMPRLGQITIDSQTALAIFNHYYPNQSFYMQKAFDWITTPPKNRNKILELMTTFGDWLINEAEEILQLPKQPH